MKFLFIFVSLLALPLTSSAEIRDEAGSRFSLSGGLIHINNPSQTVFSLSAEYEYRMDPFYGLGAQASYVFAANAITMVSAPVFFFHPLQGEWFISAAPVFYFGSSTTLVGARFMTRMPIDLFDVMMLTPTFGIDMIKGGPNYILGLALSI